MKTKTFGQEDFQVFTIDGLDARMNALKSIIRPKLTALGEELTPTISAITGEEMFAHVAKHARRTVNPPDDTWVAWANNKRGYKKHPHFQVGLWQTHFFVWFAVIYESPYKMDFAVHALPELETIQQAIPDHFVWSMDHTKPEAVPHADLSREDLHMMFERLQKVKQSELLCGIHLEKNDPTLQDETKLKDKIVETFSTLAPLYRLAQPR